MDGNGGQALSFPSLCESYAAVPPHLTLKNMITLTWTDEFESLEFTLTFLNPDGGRLRITHAGKYVTKEYVAEGGEADRIAALLAMLPGPPGINDLQEMMYDGETLRIAGESGEPVTVIGLSLAHRSKERAWFEALEETLRGIKPNSNPDMATPRKSPD